MLFATPLEADDSTSSSPSTTDVEAWERKSGVYDSAVIYSAAYIYNWRLSAHDDASIMAAMRRDNPCPHGCYERKIADAFALADKFVADPASGSFLVGGEIMSRATGYLENAIRSGMKTPDVIAAMRDDKYPETAIAEAFRLIAVAQRKQMPPSTAEPEPKKMSRWVAGALTVATLAVVVGGFIFLVTRKTKPSQPPQLPSRRRPVPA